MSFDFKQLQRLQKDFQEKMSKMQDELANQTVEASAGGGVVNVVANGNQQIVSISIKPEAIDPDDPQMLEDLVLAAVNAALEKSRELGEKSMGKLTGGLNIPILDTASSPSCRSPAPDRRKSGPDLADEAFPSACGIRVPHPITFLHWCHFARHS